MIEMQLKIGINELNFLEKILVEGSDVWCEVKWLRDELIYIQGAYTREERQRATEAAEEKWESLYETFSEHTSNDFAIQGLDIPVLLGMLKNEYAEKGEKE